MTEIGIIYHRTQEAKLVRWDGARIPICMWHFSFISALGCSYLCLACSLLGLLLPTLFVVVWMKKEVQTLFRELSCPPGQFRDVLTDLGPPWEVQPVPAWGPCALFIPIGHHGGIQAGDARGLMSRGSWTGPGRSLPYAQEPPEHPGPLCLDLSAHLSTCLHHYPHFFTRKAGRED